MHDATFVVEACMIPVLVTLSGIFAGLTIGFFSLDPTQLRILEASGSADQKRWAAKVRPVRDKGHRLLMTLIVCNMIVNETLPLVSDEVLSGKVLSVVISTVLIVVFAEIIPQSLFTRFGLRMCAAAATPVAALMWITFPLNWPVSKLLEYLIGSHDGVIYRRNELKQLVHYHAQTAMRGGDLAQDTVAIVGGALDFQAKTVRVAMTPIDRVFMLNHETKLDYDTLAEVLRSGHSRIPVYENVMVSSKDDEKGEDVLKRRVIGVLLVKQCVLLDPEDATPIRDIPLNRVPSVPADAGLIEILNTFQEGRSHMAIVTALKTKNLEHKDSLDTAGTDSETGSTKSSPRRRRWRRKASSGTEDEELGSAEKEKMQREAAEILAAQENDKRAALLFQLSPDDEQYPVGLITLEDVLEELIGEEILDEYDGERGDAIAYMPQEAVEAQKKARAIRFASLSKANSTGSLGMQVSPMLKNIQRSISGRGQARSRTQTEGTSPTHRRAESESHAIVLEPAGSGEALLLDPVLAQTSEFAPKDAIVPQLTLTTAHIHAPMPIAPQLQNVASAIRKASSARSSTPVESLRNEVRLESEHNSIHNSADTKKKVFKSQVLPTSTNIPPGLSRTPRQSQA